MNCSLNHAGYTVDIDTVKLRTRGAANRAGAVYHCIDAFNQAVQTFHVFKITIDPSCRNPGRSLMG